MKKFLLATLILFSIIKTNAQCGSFPLSVSEPTLTCTQPMGTISITTSVSPVSCVWANTPGLISGGNTLNPTVNNPGSYSFTLTNTTNGCTTTGSANVVANILVPSIAINSLTICAGTSALLSPTVSPASNITFLWSDGSSTSSIAVNPAFTTNYSVTVTDALSGCSSTASTVVNVLPGPMLTAMSSPICTGQTSTLVASGAISYSWSPGTGLSSTTGSMIYSSPATSTSYTLMGIDGNGCIALTSLMVMVSPNPIVSTAASNPTICIYSSTDLMAFGANSYTWAPATTLSSTNGNSVSASPVASTIYTVIGATGSCTDTQTLSVTVDNTCANVWPGDANSDGYADNLDILELGLHYAQTGAPRASISNNWQSYVASNWTGTITSGENLNHSDCNGDGTINNDDTLAIYTNYNSYHAFKTADAAINTQLTIVPDQASVVKGTWGSSSIYLGSASTPVNTINGLGFTVNFDNTLIEPNSIYIDYQNSFIDASQNLRFRKLDFANGYIYTATTHTNNVDVSGYGKIATLHYQVTSTLTSDQVLSIGLSGAHRIDASGSGSNMGAGTSTLTAVVNSVGVKEILNGNTISISPNPTNSLLNITSKTELQKIELISVTGQVLLSEVPASVNHILHLENFANGVYFVNLHQNNGSIIRERIVVSK